LVVGFAHEGEIFADGVANASLAIGSEETGMDAQDEAALGWLGDGAFFGFEVGDLDRPGGTLGIGKFPEFGQGFFVGLVAKELAAGGDTTEVAAGGDPLFIDARGAKELALGGFGASDPGGDGGGDKVFANTFDAFFGPR
jgi:hypothetical protein